MKYCCECLLASLFLELRNGEKTYLCPAKDPKAKIAERVVYGLDHACMIGAAYSKLVNEVKDHASGFCKENMAGMLGAIEARDKLYSILNKLNITPQGRHPVCDGRVDLNCSVETFDEIMRIAYPPEDTDDD